MILFNVRVSLDALTNKGDCRGSSPNGSDMLTSHAPTLRLESRPLTLLQHLTSLSYGSVVVEASRKRVRVYCDRWELGLSGAP